MNMNKCERCARAHVNARTRRNSVLSAAVNNRSNLMEPDEVIVRLKDRILQHSAAMLESFHEFSNPATQRLGRRDFRRVRRISP